MHQAPIASSQASGAPSKHPIVHHCNIVRKPIISQITVRKAGFGGGLWRCELAARQDQLVRGDLRRPSADCELKTHVAALALPSHDSRNTLQCTIQVLAGSRACQGSQAVGELVIAVDHAK